MKHDPFVEHLIKHNLLEVHEQAQQVGYRVRTANDYQFELEYEAGLPDFNRPENAIKAFENSEQGIAQAKAFLAMVQTIINQIKRQRGE